jgi:hypothetical protein
VKMAPLESPISIADCKPSALRGLRESLIRQGFTSPGLVSLLGLGQVSRLYPLEYRELPFYAQRLNENSTPLSVLARLLVLGLPENESAVLRVLGAENLPPLFDSGLCCREAGVVHANFTLLPFDGLLIATDRIFPNVDDHNRDRHLSSDNMVWRLDQTSWILARHLLQTPVKEALDLGCGSGLQTLLLSGRAKQALGVDINPRAVNLAKFNALLNGIENARFVCGDLYQPAAGRFGQIISNPPSAPGLVRAWNREGGVTGREVAEKIMDGLAGHLEAGGIYQGTLHLGYGREEDIPQWMKARLPQEAYSCLVLKHHQEEDSVKYALRESYQKSGPRDFAVFQRTFSLYQEGLKKAGIEKISFGLVAACRDGRGRPPEVVTADLVAGDPEELRGRLRQEFLIP